MPLLGREADTQVFRDIDENPDDETFPGIPVVRLDGGLFFATAEALEDRVRALTEDGQQIRALVIDLEGVDFVDSQGAAKLAEIHQLTEADGITLRLARIKPNVLRVLRSDGIIDLIGPDHIHGNVNRAIEAELAQTATTDAPPKARDHPGQPA
jgi:anti-anti-sigma factor